MRALWVFALALVFAGLAAPGEAYIGPGAGLTVLGAVWAVLAAVGLAVLGILLWPLRMLLRRRKLRREQAERES